jgi:hypothetical protein
MLESIVGFLAKIAFWAFAVGVVIGIYLGVRFWPGEHPGAGGVSCVAPAPAPHTGPGSTG